MDSSPFADVLLETVAQMPQAGTRTAQVGRIGKPSGSDRAQQEKLLAPLQDDGDTKRHDQRMAGITRTRFNAHPVDSVSLSGIKSARMTVAETANLLNRRMRSRTHGGVGIGTNLHRLVSMTRFDDHFSFLFESQKLRGVMIRALLYSLITNRSLSPVTIASAFPGTTNPRTIKSSGSRHTDF